MANIFDEFVFRDKSSLKSFVDSTKEVAKRGKNKGGVGLAELVGFYLEHHIKHFYAELVKSIEVLLGSSVSFVKKTAIGMLASLTKH